jgi:hypothetical protein
MPKVESATLAAGAAMHVLNMKVALDKGSREIDVGVCD